MFACAQHPTDVLLEDSGPCTAIVRDIGEPLYFCLFLLLPLYSGLVASRTTARPLHWAQSVCILYTVDPNGKE